MNNSTSRAMIRAAVENGGVYYFDGKKLGSDWWIQLEVRGQTHVCPLGEDGGFRILRPVIGTKDILIQDPTPVGGGYVWIDSHEFSCRVYNETYSNRVDFFGKITKLLYVGVEEHASAMF